MAASNLMLWRQVLAVGRLETTVVLAQDPHIRQLRYRDIFIAPHIILCITR